MNIVNLIHIGDEVLNIKDLSPEERKRIALQLSIQALEPLGYVLETSSAEEE